MPYDFKQLKKQLSKFLGYFSRTELVLVPHEELLRVYQPVTDIDWIIAQSLGGVSVLKNGRPVILISKKYAVNKTVASFIAGHEIVEEYLRIVSNSESSDSERITYSPVNVDLGRNFPLEPLWKAKQRIVKFLLEDDYNLDSLLEELIRDKEKEAFAIECRNFNHRSLKEGFCTVLGGVLANYQPESPEKDSLKQELIGAVERAENNMKNWQTLEKHRNKLISSDFEILQKLALYTTLIYDSGILKCINDLRSKTISAWEEPRVIEWARKMVNQIIKPEKGVLHPNSGDENTTLFLRSLKELEKTRMIYKEARSKAYFLGLEIDKSLIQTQETLSPIRTDLENLLE
ncbi:MAG: hypothetical protein ACFFD4_17335 [Candidatus Odinarchaeota archaeon]